MRKPTVRDRLEYALFAGAIGAAGRMSHERSQALGSALGRLGYRQLGIRRAVVEAHLRQAFPERDDQWVSATAEASYEHLGREMMMTLRLSHMNRDEVVRTVDHAVGRERFYEAFHERRGLVLVGGHFGNWELGAGSVAAQNFPVDAIYQPQRNPLFDRAMVSARERLGLHLIPRHRATGMALDKLRLGRIVAFVADQNAGRSGAFVPFFGRLASTHRGAALLAVRSGAPIFLGAAIRQGDGYHGISVEITASREGPLDEVVHRLTAAFTAELEKLVRQWPEQYFWHHRRWKTRPPGEPPGSPTIPE
jgi:Kdo2-lipid IVA lauroyltransferase/acyltransferase